MEAKNVDDILVARMNETAPSPVETSSEPENVPQETPQVGAIDPQPESKPQVSDEKSQETKEEPVVSETEEQKMQEKVDDAIDEYGNPVEKPKMYSEEEVNRLIRERLARGKLAEKSLQPEQQPQQSAESEENWEQQLEQFVDRTIEKRQRKLQEEQWQAQQAALQAEFETKFSSGMNKYSDFQQVVAGKPITDDMMLATRSLENPAAFIYGASKFHSQDLERIAKLRDPLSQAAEIGRLHEKMIKSKKILSDAQKPIEIMSSDMPGKKSSDYPSLEQRIHEYAKQKRK